MALQGTPWEGALDGAVTTHNMRSTFVNSGLFAWLGMDFLAEPGDPYLSEANHVAMCQTQHPDVLSEFSWGDNGAYGNLCGDQGGWEASVHGCCDYSPGGRDGILRFIGDGDAVPPGAESPASQELPAELPMPRFRVAVMRDGRREWLPWMRGKIGEGGSSDTFAGEPGCGIVDIEFEGGTLGPEGRFSKNMDGDGLIGLTVFYDTPDPASTGYCEALYRAHWLSDPPARGKYEHDDDDGGAGDDVHQLDMIELAIAPC